MTFTSGQRVRTRLIVRPGHCRLPLYARGRVGTIAAHRGDFPLPDDIVRHGSTAPQHLYSVRFDARQLWGPNAPDHVVHLDLFESYLEPLDSRRRP